MSRPFVSRFRGTFRFCWRSARTLGVCLLLCVVTAFVYLHNVGLPELLKERLVRGLHAQGWDMEYSRLRFRWMKGVVGEGLYFRPASGGAGPELFVDQVDFRLNREALLRFQFIPESFRLNQGRCVWVLRAEGEKPQSLALEGVDGLLKYREPDTFEISGLKGRLHGVQIGIEAHITNASKLLTLRWPRRQVRAEQGVNTEQFLHGMAVQWDRCQVDPGTAIALKLAGDVMRTNSFNAEVTMALPSIDSPWLTGTNAVFWAGVAPPVSLEEPFVLRWRLDAGLSRTPWGEAELIEARGRMEQRIGEALASAGEIELVSREVVTPWGEGASIQFSGAFSAVSRGSDTSQARFALEGESLSSKSGSLQQGRLEASLRVSTTNWNPLSGGVQLSGVGITGLGGSVSNLHFGLSFTNPPDHQIAQTSGAKGFERLVERLKPLQLEATLSATGFSMPKLEVADCNLLLDWNAPVLRVSPLKMTMNGGELDVRAGLDTRSGHLSATVTNTTDAHRFALLLGTKAQRWLGQYGWKKPPWVRADASLVLPDWAEMRPLLSSTNLTSLSSLPWARTMMPTLRIDGRAKVGSGDFRGVEFDSATLSFQCSNDVWVVPDIVAHRPEGTLELYHESNETTRDYLFKLRSRINLDAIRPLLPASAAEGFNLFTFAEPPLIEGEIRGRWRFPEGIVASARVSANRFTFRGEDVGRFEAGSVEFANRLLRARDILFVRPEGRATLGEVWFQLDEQKLRLTNVVSGLDVAPVCRAIGTNVSEIMKDYRFDSPPSVRLEGVIDTLKARKENDIKFQVDASPFSWKLFNISRIQALVDWRRDTLDLREVRTDFYGGRMLGDAHFDFRPDRGSDFQFGLRADNVDLALLMKDLGSKTNRIEGRVACELNITNANTRDKFTWNGYGRGEMTNGLLWDIPFFAVISPALNAIVPGVANSRARQATGTFLITNGVIYTGDLDIRANAMRMKSAGTVNFDKQLNARMEAELLRDTPGIGFLISKVFWPVTKLFEFKLTGTLDKPKTDQRYIVPRLLLFPLHPIRTLKDWFGGDEKSDANAKGDREPESTPPAKP